MLGRPMLRPIDLTLVAVLTLLSACGGAPSEQVVVASDETYTSSGAEAMEPEPLEACAGPADAADAGCSPETR